MRFASLPLEFRELEGSVEYIIQRGRDEFSGTCPSCGGTVHDDGSFPDRFRMFSQSKTTGKPMGWCRSCGYTWWPGKTKGARWEPSEEEKLAWYKERHDQEERRAREVEEARKILNQEMLAEKYHNLLNQEAIDLYRSRGISDHFWLDFWQLGYCPKKFAHSGDISFSSPSLTIPVFEPTIKTSDSPSEKEKRRVLSIEHRLIHPVDPGDKYRPETKGLPSVLFIADYERPLKGKTLLVEGKFKAIVTYIFADDPGLHVVGLPGKCPDTELLSMLDDCEPLIFCLDPDAFERKKSKYNNGRNAVERLSMALGGRARAMDLPDKIDDLFVRGIINKNNFHRLMDTSRKINVHGLV